jgi:VWFA-related protein
MEISMGLRVCIGQVLLASCSLLSAHAQTAAATSQEQIPTFKAGTKAVIVDVVVTNSKDEAVTGLHKQDFQVSENGEPQAIAFFEEHLAPSVPPVEMPPMPPNVFTNVPSAPRGDAVNVLLIDALNTPKIDQVLVRQQTIEFLKQMPPGTELAVFTLGTRLRMVQGFTTDSSTLLASLQDKKSGVWPETTGVSHSPSDDQADLEEIERRKMMAGGAGGPHGAASMGVTSDAGFHTGNGATEAIDSEQFAQAATKNYQNDQRILMTIEALQNLSRYLAKIPGRKNLIWFARDFPIAFFPTSTVRSSHEAAIGVRNQEVKATADMLAVSKVAIYPVGAQGLENPALFDPQTASIKISVAMQGIGDAEAANNASAMAELADETGGEVFKNTNDLSHAVSRVVQNGSHYYTISYTPTDKKMDGQFRAIQVKLNKEGYRLSYRRGYYAIDTLNAKSRPESSDPLHPLLQRGAPASTKILYGVRVNPAQPQPAANAPHAGANPKLVGPVTRYSLDFMIRWTDLSLEPMPDGSHQGKVRVELIAYDRDGKALNWVGGVTKMNLKAEIFESIQKSGVPAHIEIDVPKGDVFLATGVFDVKTGKAGTLEVPLSKITMTAASK